MARWLSQAVDFAKNGMKVDLDEFFAHKEFKVKGIPNFQRPVYESRNNFPDTSGEYYQSSKLLGRIYQSNIDTDFPRICAIGAVDNSGLQNVLTTVWEKKHKMLTEAWERQRKEKKPRVIMLYPKFQFHMTISIAGLRRLS
jgi:hypothetical protein